MSREYFNCVELSFTQLYTVIVYGFGFVGVFSNTATATATATTTAMWVYVYTNGIISVFKFN